MSKDSDNMNEVLIVCALLPEAKAILVKYDLHFQCGECGFKLYGAKSTQSGKNSDISGKVRVLIAGVGKTNMAAAMMWVRQFCLFRRVINVGLSGHGVLSIGDTALINQIIDDSSNQAFYPSINFRWRGQQSALKTLSAPSDKYSSKYAFDMEASAFFDIANRCLTNDKIHVLKVVSDNPENPYKALSKKALQTCYATLLTALTELLEIVVFNDKTKTDQLAIIEEIKRQWHLTATREMQLKETLNAVVVMEKNTGDRGPQWQSYNNAANYLKDCKKWLQNIEPKIV